MNYYEIWFNLADSHKDLEFAENLQAYLGWLQSNGKIASWRLSRRKFGFGPPELGEFHVTISCETLTQLDEAFAVVAPRSGELEKLHARVYSMVTDFRAGLYRDFPDEQRKR
ncbi:MAG: hypothetical protein IPK83_13325 [Planctomycetes bacterium]|nr:hypothetical protein [Planctomycetota bacterium]